MRFSVSTLLFLVSLSAVFGAAIANNNLIRTQITFTIFLIWVLAAVLLAIYGTSSTRAFALGAALFGAAFLFLSGSLVHNFESANFIHRAFEISFDGVFRGYYRFRVH